MSIGSVMFSRAVSVGSRLNAWKMKPILSRRSWVSCLSFRRAELGVADADRAGGEGVQAGHAVHQRGLAGAGGAHDRGELGLPELDGDPVQGDHLGLALSVDLGQVRGAGGHGGGAVGDGVWWSRDGAPVGTTCRFGGRASIVRVRPAAV